MNEFSQPNSYDRRNHHGTSTKKPVKTSQKGSSCQKKLTGRNICKKKIKHKCSQGSRRSNLKQDPMAYKKYLQKDHQGKKHKVVNITPPVQSLTLPGNPTITTNQSPSTSTLLTPCSNSFFAQICKQKQHYSYLKVLRRRLMWFPVSFTTSHHHQEKIWAKWWDGCLVSLPPHVENNLKEFLLTLCKSKGIRSTMTGSKDQDYIGKGPDSKPMY